MHLTSQELADIFGVSIQTVHNWVKQRELPHHRTFGRQLRFSPNEVRSFCEAQQMVVPKGLLALTEPEETDEQEVDSGAGQTTIAS